MKKTLIWLGLIAASAVFMWFYFSGIPDLGKFSEVLPGTYQRELQRIKSPDQRLVAVFWHKEKHGMGLPPEPPKTLERWVRLKITRTGMPIYDSSYENLNVYQRSFGLDAMWSPDSGYLAYRHINTLRTIDSDGKAVIQDMLPEHSAISSFRWMDKGNLVIVSKKLESPLSGYDTHYPCYPSYCEKAVGIRITRLSLTKGKTVLHEQPIKATTFLFHALDFLLDEISPAANRIAFSDGGDLCIYDVEEKKVIAKVAIPRKPPVTTGKPGDDSPEILESINDISARPQELEGLWWQSNEVLIVGMGLLGSNTKFFYTYEIPSKRLTDVTHVLLPIWDGSDEAKNYRDSDWYRTAIHQAP